MKIHRMFWLVRNEVRVIALFGDARLVQKHNGRVELMGGSPGDRAAAREWCSLFMHEAVIANEASISAGRATRAFAV